MDIIAQMILIMFLYDIIAPTHHKEHTTLQPR